MTEQGGMQGTLPRTLERRVAAAVQAARGRLWTLLAAHHENVPKLSDSI